jgi:hypothetical protein
VATDGYERVGLFARDDGNANFDADSLGGGNCYALTYDSDTGRIRAGVVEDGVFTDFLETTPLVEPSTAWRTLQIDCAGTRIRYFVDGLLVANVIDATHAAGRFGIGHHEYFGNDANAHGTHAEDFSLRCNAFDFDFDDDGDVDLADLLEFEFCFQGPGVTYAPGHFCTDRDADGDLDVDVADFAVFQMYFTGP